MKLKKEPALYPSDRDKDDVLVGSDVAAPLIHICAIGDSTSLRKMLARPQYRGIALTSSHRIYSADISGAQQPRVLARPMLNLEFMMEIATRNDRPDIVRCLLDFASENGIRAKDIIDRTEVSGAVRSHDPSLFAVLAEAYPETVNWDLGHGVSALEQAVGTGQLSIVEFLLTHGVKMDSTGFSRTSAGSLFSRCAYRNDVHMAELLLKHGAFISGSGALHVAAKSGSLDLMELLYRHGAKLDELLPPSCFEYRGGTFACHPNQETELSTSSTPLHFAAYGGSHAAMGWLQAHGVDIGMKDAKGLTAQQIIERRRNLGQSSPLA
ncbi:hypothetical protein LTR37_007597 [Vermiconidia calcicola]|uniref:Uncharacterized protein n=1 Tax=Vermiconidia calcicola TaxID=1690605 RepID=A0ACC3ND80_9PEZI|nr:hypothetical protein LTR37_007597 [Vermiconidia calcicola]